MDVNLGGDTIQSRTVAFIFFGIQLKERNGNLIRKVKSYPAAIGMMDYRTVPFILCWYHLQG